MIRQLWVNENRIITICVDDYEGGIPKGRVYHSTQGMSSFQSLTQLLLKMEWILEELQEPQSYTAKRTFSSTVPADEEWDCIPRFRDGGKATFELKVLFRQHSSWQGVIVWKDRQHEQSFRSVLELVFLLDSALRDSEEMAAS